MGKTTEKITPSMKETLINLYNEGKMDTEIANVLNVSRSAIFYWRKQLGLKTRFTYSKIAKLDIEKHKDLLLNKELSDYKIADILGLSHCCIRDTRIKLKVKRRDLRYSQEVPLNHYQIEVLIGTVLGDSSLRASNDAAQLICTHSPKQYNYILNKLNIFKNMGTNLSHYKRNIPNKKTNKRYSYYVIRSNYNPILLPFYNSFYKDGIKIIPRDLISKYFSRVSLAYMFMDDGCKFSKYSYSIATNCFSIEDLKWFQAFLKSKFNLETTILKSKVLYIKACSKDLFTYLVKPYINDCVKYKLITVS